MSSVVCQTYTVAVTHRPFTVVNGLFTWENISQGKFIAVSYSAFSCVDFDLISRPRNIQQGDL